MAVNGSIEEERRRISILEWKVRNIHETNETQEEVERRILLLEWKAQYIHENMKELGLDIPENIPELRCKKIPPVWTELAPTKKQKKLV